jgi:hypothetical protein
LEAGHITSFIALRVVDCNEKEILASAITLGLPVSVRHTYRELVLQDVGLVSEMMILL